MKKSGEQQGERKKKREEELGPSLDLLVSSRDEFV